MDMWLIIFMFLGNLYMTSAIDCYKCTRISNASECHTVTYCPNQQNCFVQINGEGVNQTFTLGCADDSTCGITTSTTAATVTLPSHTPNTTTPLSTHVHTTHTFTTTTEPFSDNMTDGFTTTGYTTAVTTASEPSIVGRRYLADKIESPKTCCGTDGCNKKIAITTPSPPDSLCQDKPDFGCDVAITYFNICSNVQKAKVLCKKSCDLCDLVDGKWSEWGNWSNCDVTCGNGTQQRTRKCDNPSPANGGDNCTGSDMEPRLCTEQNCPIDGDWGDWVAWSECSVTCGIGLQNRIRNCSNPYPDADGLFCLGAARDDKICLRKHCDGDTWLEWSNWSKCSQSCGIGLMTRTRNCNNTSLFGHSCSGYSRETQLCKNSECPAKLGKWLDWSAWSVCSHTCDTGIKTRSRDCNDTAQSCFGDIHESVLCIEKECTAPMSAFLVNGVVYDGPDNGTIVLSQVVTNVGGDYNTSTGQFTCRIPGVYSFFISIEKQPDVNQAYCQLMKNENATIYVGSRSAFIHDNTFQQASNSAVLELDINDVIYLGRCSAAETFTTKSTFSGSLLMVQKEKS